MRAHVSDFMFLAIVLAVWAAFGTAIGVLAKRKHRHAVAWGLIGGFPYLALPTAILLCFMPVLCPECKTALTNKQWKARACPKCAGPAGPEVVATSRHVGWRWVALLIAVVAIAILYTWSTSSVRRSVEAFCDSVAIGDPSGGIEARGRAARLTIVTSSPRADTSGPPHDAVIFVHRSSPFFYVYNCWIYHKDGKVVGKHAAGGAL